MINMPNVVEITLLVGSIVILFIVSKKREEIRCRRRKLDGHAGIIDTILNGSLNDCAEISKKEDEESVWRPKGSLRESSLGTPGIWTKEGYQYNIYTSGGMMKVKVTCDRCKAEFKIELQEEKVNDTAAKVYFTCSECGKEYLSHYTNQSIKAKQKKIREAQKQYAALLGKKDVLASTNVWKKYQKLKKEIGKEMGELKRCIEGSRR